MRSSSVIALSGIVAVLIGSLTFSQNIAAEEVSRGALLASMCNSCHGTDGKGSVPMAAIAGMEVDDFVDLMQAFASGDQKTSIMGRHSEGYTEAELKLIAEYFSKQ